jgi:hypothetical protein
MFEVNIKIISELKSFLQICSTDNDVLDALRNTDRAFTRKRKLDFSSLVLFICKLCKKTLSVELDTFFESDLSRDHSCTVSALSQQRGKLLHRFFRFWNVVLCSSFYKYATQAQCINTWRGLRLIAADGTGVSLISTPALRAHFGGQSNQQGHFSGAKAFVHYDVLNKLFVYSRLAPYRTPELELAWDAIALLPSDAICIYDRNFSNYKTMALHLWARGGCRPFLIRAKERMNIVKSFLRTGLCSQRITMYPASASVIAAMSRAHFRITSSTGIEVRLVRVELGNGTTEVLFTNLWEEDGYGSELFAELYFKRWGVETAIGTAKNLMQLESMSGLSVESVYQDFYATIFMTNLASLFSRQAQETAHIRTTEHQRKPRRWPMQVNMNKAGGRLRSSIVQLFLSADPEEILAALIRYFTRHMLPIRKGRTFARKRKNKQSNSKHKTFSNYKPAD